MRKFLVCMGMACLISVQGISISSASIQPGSKCSGVNSVKIIGNFKYTCLKSAKGLIWNRVEIPVLASKNPSDAIAQKVNAELIDGTSIDDRGGAGVFLKEVNGAVISSFNSNFIFEPASSIKALVALYAFNLINEGKLKLDDQFPSITSDDPHGCSKPKSNTQESIRSAIKEMMQVSDNDRTNALIMYFGVGKLNTFAKNIGLKQTKFATTKAPPGFNFVGCVIPSNLNNDPVTISGNESSLRDLTRIWELADSLPESLKVEFRKLTAGKEMFEQSGQDYSGIWPALKNLVSEEAPKDLSPASQSQFNDLMSGNSKGGSVAICFKSTQCKNVRWWVSMISLTSLPVCTVDKTIAKKDYVWGYFVAGSDSSSDKLDQDNPAVSGFLKVGAEPMRAEIRKALAGWGACLQ